MLGHASMRVTTDTYRTALPEMHAATASAPLDLFTAYRKAEAPAEPGARTAFLRRTTAVGPSVRPGTRTARGRPCPAGLRQMCGRANFDLLRRRILLAA